MIHALRGLRRNPMFAAMAIFTLAIGIGANTAIFSVIDTVLLRPLPYRDPDAIVTLWQTDARTAGSQTDVAVANFADWRQQARSFEAMAAVEPYSFDYYAGTEPEVLSAALVTEGFFEAVGNRMLLGRPLAAGDYREGEQRVAVISFALFRRHFGADPGVVGRLIQLDNQPYTVIGVLPPEFQLRLFEYESSDVWAPRILRPKELASPQARVADYWNVVARLKPSVTIDQAQTEMAAISQRLAAEYPRSNAYTGVKVTRLHDQLFAHITPTLWMLVGAVAIVLLIAAVNVANLLIANGVQRRRELSIRTALGATRGRLVRQLFVEGAMVALLAAVAGVIIGNLTLAALLALAPAELPYVHEAQLDRRVLAATLGLAAFATLLFGAAPSLGLSKLDIRGGLVEGGRTATSGAGRQRLRAGLVVAEVALAVTLMITAGLLVRSFTTVLSVDPGFRKENVLALQVFAWDRNTSHEKRVAFFHETLSRIEALPGVISAGAATAPPFFVKSDLAIAIDVTIDDLGPAQQPLSAFANTVTPRYFATMGIPLRAGRGFSEHDTRESAPVAIVNDTMAQRHWPGENPIGRRITFRFGGSREIVGVVGDVRHGGLDRAARPEVFVPHRQNSTASMTYTVRTTSDPALLMQRVKETIWSVDTLQTFYATGVMEDLVASSLTDRRFTLTVTAVFAAIAFLLAIVGLYGVIAFVTSQRTSEIGVRVALGASRGDILQLVMGQGVKLVALGLVAGVCAALAASRILSTFLFGVTPTDPGTYIIASAVLLVAGIMACAVPARRAASIDPLVAIRCE